MNEMAGPVSVEPELDLPIVHVIGQNLPEAWERAVLETWRRGATIATQYDRPGDPPSRDALAVIAVADPFAEPRIHRALPGGLGELEAYRQEVVDGIHDHWVDPAAGKWEYTYHDRLVRYSLPDGTTVNQLSQVVDALVEATHTRRAQAIMWKPWEDAGIVDPPCLQRMWFRVFNGRLVLNIHMRSNDAFKAAFMNMYAFTDIQRAVAEELSARLHHTIRPGQYTHIADSFHIYGSYFEEFQSFLDLVANRPFERRTFRTEDVADMIAEARALIERSVEAERKDGRKGL
jgi:thymidylate synthase